MGSLFSVWMAVTHRASRWNGTTKWFQCSEVNANFGFVARLDALAQFPSPAALGVGSEEGAPVQIVFGSTKN
jgi:hypothetical protein